MATGMTTAGAGTVLDEVPDVVPFWLTAGDPGPKPWPTEEPFELACRCAPAPETFWAVPGVTPPAPATSPLVTDLRASVGALVRHGAVSGSRRDTSDLLALAEQVRALALRELAEMDAVGGHQRPGVTSTTASWLRQDRHLSDGAARSAVQLATALRDDLPAVGALLSRGQISIEHAGAVVAGVRGLDAAVVSEAEQGLCELALLTDPADLRKRLRDKAAAVDDRIAAEVERKARDRMGLRLNDVGGHTAVDGTLAGEDGAVVRLAMDLAVEAGRQPDDNRSRAARQAEVLVGWAADHLTRVHGSGDSVADDAHTVRTHLHVMCRPDQLLAGVHAGALRPSLAELLRRDLTGNLPAAAGIAGDAGVLSRSALRRLACDAVVDLVALNPGQPGDPLYVGRAARLVGRELFRALVVRDRGCVVAGCRRRPAQCAAHHVEHWADGGLTDLDNVVLLCHQHHHDHHDRRMDLPHRDGVRWLTQHGWEHSPP